MAQRVPSLADLCAYRLAHFSQHHKVTCAATLLDRASHQLRALCSWQIDLDSFAALPEELLQRIMKMLRVITSPVLLLRVLCSGGY